MLSLAFIVFCVFLAIFGPSFLVDPTIVEMSREVDGTVMRPPFAPNPKNIFGTDQLGRDIFSRSVTGLRTSLIVGLVVRGITMVVGVVIGLLAGYFGGIFDEIVMRLTDIMLVFPALLLAMTISAVLGTGFFTLCLALVLVAWPDVARLVRSQTISIKEEVYVEAARAVGVPRWRILFRHILPNCLGPIIVSFSMGIPGAIMYEAGLSFFGFGLRPPIPSLGNIIADGRGYITVAPWYPGFPGLLLTLLVLSFNLLGDGLVDALNPKSAANINAN